MNDGRRTAEVDCFDCSYAVNSGTPRIFSGEGFRTTSFEGQATLGHSQPSMTARYRSKMNKLAIDAATAERLGE